jgi:hypothetical protein
MVRYVTRKGKEAFHLKEEKKVDHQIVSLASERSAKRLDKRRNDYIRKKESRKSSTSEGRIITDMYM